MGDQALRESLKLDLRGGEGYRRTRAAAYNYFRHTHVPRADDPLGGKATVRDEEHVPLGVAITSDSGPGSIPLKTKRPSSESPGRLQERGRRAGAFRLVRAVRAARRPRVEHENTTDSGVAPGRARTHRRSRSRRVLHVLRRSAAHGYVSWSSISSATILSGSTIISPFRTIEGSISSIPCAIHRFRHRQPFFNAARSTYVSATKPANVTAAPTASRA